MSRSRPLRRHSGERIATGQEAPPARDPNGPRRARARTSARAPRQGSRYQERRPAPRGTRPPPRGLEPGAERIACGAGAVERGADRLAIGEAAAHRQGGAVAVVGRSQQERHFGAPAGRELDHGAAGSRSGSSTCPDPESPAPARAPALGRPSRAPPTHASRAVGLEGECPSAVQRMDEPRVLFAGGTRPAGDEEGAIPGHVFGLRKSFENTGWASNASGSARTTSANEAISTRSRPPGAIDDRDPPDLQRALRLLGAARRSRSATPGPPWPDRLDASRLPVESARLRCLGRATGPQGVGSAGRSGAVPIRTSIR